MSTRRPSPPGFNPFGWPTVARVALAPVAVGVALWLRMLIASVLPLGGFPFLTFYPAVLLVTFVAGVWPGLLTCVLSLGAAWFFLIEPTFEFVGITQADIYAMGFFIAVLIANVAMLHAMHVALARGRIAEAERAESEERVRSVLDNLYVYAGLLDLDGTLREVNRAPLALSGLQRADVLDKPLWESFWWAHDAQGQQRLRAAVARAAGGETVRYDTGVQDPAGRRQTIDLQIAPLRDADGRVVSLVASAVDVTARLAAMSALLAREAALKHADRQKDVFLATLAHELRNPLAPIRSASHIIGMRPAVDDQVRRAAAIIERQSAHLARLVEDLLDLSRISAGNLQLRLGTVDLRRVVESALETCQPLVEAARHDLVVRLPAEPMLVRGDETRLAQCVANLVQNAVKFTPPPGHIGVELGIARPGWAQLRVTDNGQGVGPDLLPRVFELFVQERHSGMAGNSGLGIGLALTRHLVELHGGQVQAHSDGPGKGAEFAIEVPLVEAAQPAPPPPPEAMAAPAAALQPRVLVVDDNADAAALLHELFAIEGYPVTVALDGTTAVEAVRRDQPDVVVLDIGLPDISGYDVARQLRSDAGLRQPLIVALTGWGDEHAREQARAAGIDRHLTKPADFGELLQAIQEHFADAEQGQAS